MPSVVGMCACCCMSFKMCVAWSCVCMCVPLLFTWLRVFNAASFTLKSPTSIVLSCCAMWWNCVM